MTRGSLQYHVSMRTFNVHDLVKADRRITIRMIAEKFGISNDSVQTRENFKRRFKHAETVQKLFQKF